MCSLEAEISAPRKNGRPGAGSMSFQLDFLPFAHPSAIDSNSTDPEVEQCYIILETIFRDASCIDFETLCIEANK
jgi:exosome complex RNA-binding protein Rrp42 (RNase PH superfamily)